MANDYLRTISDEYYKFADNLADNSSALQLSNLIKQDMRRYNRNFTREQEAEYSW